jgi:hypothetical protein
MISDLNIPKSIVNPNVFTKDVIDLDNPMSFLTFIKIINESFDAELNQKLYNQYLSEWTKIKNQKDNDLKNIIVERYREFIQDINLKYTTVEEKKFLKNIDFNNPSDLDIAIPFYSKKLIEICDYYNEKREDTKFQIKRNQIKGTSDYVKKEIKNLILNYFENVQESEISFNIEEIKQTLSVDIEELYDTYPLYFNQTPSERIYDNKDLDYGYDIFLKNDQQLIDEIFKDLSEDVKTLKEVDSLFENKRKLTRKYLGNDFYYISTGNTVNDFVSGLAINVDYPVSNFLNVDYPTTASTENNKILINDYEMGFFKPSKTSILLVDGKIESFEINFDKLEPNKIYYFPDPNIRGKNGDILTFTNNDSALKRNFSSGKANNSPTSDKNDSKYYGYISQVDPNFEKYLDKIFESGYIHDSKFDVWNNLFGLFKNDGSFIKNIKLKEVSDVQDFNILNGHTFYDFLYGEGYSFDYSVFDDSTILNTIRSGLSTNTNGFSSFPSINIFGGRFTDEFVYPSNFFESQQILDGVFIANDDEPLIDTISSDLSVFPTNGMFYYTNLIEGGIHDASIPQRALLDPLYPSISADATQTIIPDGINSFMIDGGTFFTVFDDVIYDKSKIYFDDTVLNTTNYVVSSTNDQNLYERLGVNGGIYVKNSNTKKVDKLENVIPYITNVLPLSVYSQVISAVDSFEIVNDVLFIETANNLIITRLMFDGENFVDPKTQTYIIKHNQNSFNKVSKRFKLDKNIHFMVLTLDNYPPSVDVDIIPEFYTLNLKSFILNKEINNPNSFRISTSGISYSKIEKPTISYNPRKKVMNNSFLLKDSTNFFNLVEVDYKIEPFQIIKISEYLQK